MGLVDVLDGAVTVTQRAQRTGQMQMREGVVLLGFQAGAKVVRGRLPVFRRHLCLAND